MQASELVTRALRLINVPGRGAFLAPEDQDSAFSALQEVLDSEAVSKQFVPGIRRHFFPMISGKAIYSYGASPQADLRSDDFDDDPLPTKVEDAYIRSGSNIINSEVVDEYRFENLGTWVLGGAGAAITNNQLKIELVVDTATQPLTAGAAIIPGRTYTLRFDADVFAGGFELLVRDSAVAFQTFVITSSGLFEFDFVWPTIVAPDILIQTTDAGDDIRLDSVSLIERGLRRLDLPDPGTSDYRITVIDQGRYNRRFTKGTGGRPYELLFTRDFPVGELRFDNAAISGDILVMDVLVNRVQVARLNSTVRMHGDAIKWLRYATADNVAGEYGKSLNARQITIMDNAWDKLASGNRRKKYLGVDRLLRDRPTFDINRGDP